jgi:phosphomannomutase
LENCEDPVLDESTFNQFPFDPTLGTLALKLAMAKAETNKVNLLISLDRNCERIAVFEHGGKVWRPLSAGTLATLFLSAFVLESQECDSFKS